MPKPFAKPLALSALTLLLVACTAADPFGDELGTKTGASGAEPRGQGTCTKSTTTGLDPKSFQDCEGSRGAAGRCVTDKEIGDYVGEFDKGSCASGACVPEGIVQYGKTVQLKTCEVLGKEGRCFSTLARSISESYDLLKSISGKQCEAGTLCAPCVDPRSGKKTGVCELGGAASAGGCTHTGASSQPAPTPAPKCPYDGPPIDTSKFPEESCGSNMLCVPKDLVPAAQQSNLASCSSGLCAPKKSVAAAGNFVPKTCRSLNGAEGRCTNVNIPEIAAKTDSLPIGGECDADEACAPCFDPFDGTDTGACRTASCDAPKEPKVVFASCCGGRAKCIPKTSIDDKSEASLKQDTCESTSLCVPTELATAPEGLQGAQPCKFDGVLFGIGAYEGVCVSDCFGGGLTTKPKQGNCPSGLACVPCKNLDPGVPGCR